VKFGEGSAGKFFVEFCDLACDDGGTIAEDIGCVDQRRGDAARGFVENDRRGNIGDLEKSFRRSPFFDGRNPQKKIESVGRPEAATAFTNALAPGIGTTSTPASIARSTIRKLGSEIPGVPASETTATDSPFVKSLIRSSARSVSLCSW
jgi:hypothetical protein